LYYKGEELLAVDAMNEPRVYMVSKRLLEAGKSISVEQAMDHEFDLKSLL
jgi:3-phenylpropionate/trans-cinnamate dioxygenase ferredoxin reductase subunit